MNGVKILKSTNGIDWFEIPSNITKGTSSRSMMVYNNKLYLTVMADGEDLPSLLYSSVDPELFGWTLETPEGGEEGKNPIGTIWTIASFNNHLYPGTSSKKGFMLWRTEGSEPELNHWKLIIKNGGGHDFNSIPISLVEFNDHLYIGTGIDTTAMLCYVFPVGCEILRVDKNDNIETVVGYNTPINKDDNDMYIGTANPFQGCEVYKLNKSYVFQLS